MKIFFSLIIGGSIWSYIGGSFLLSPLSVSIVVVTKKKISNKKAISAIDPAFTSGDFLGIAYFFKDLILPDKTISPTATIDKI